MSSWPGRGVRPCWPTVSGLRTGVALAGTLWLLFCLPLVQPARALINLGTLDFGTASYVADVELVGTTVYAAADDLRIIDVSDPTAPVEIAVFDTSKTSVVDVVGGLAYIKEQANNRFSVIDVSNPAAPVRVGSLVLDGTNVLIADIEVVGAIAYVADVYYDLRVIDVSNPAAPVEIATLPISSSCYDVEVVGEIAYVAAWNAGLRVIDVSNPVAPVEIGFFDQNGVTEVEVVGSVAYLDSFGPLRVVDISNPTAPVELGALEMPDFDVDDLKVVGGRAYVVGTESDVGMVSGLRVIDVSVPASPAVLATLDTPGAAASVAVAGGVAYVGDDRFTGYDDEELGTAGLRVIDVSNPSAPVELGALDTPGWASDAYVVGGIAYLADESSGIRAIDISEPASLVELGALDTPGIAYDVEVVGSLAYVADELSGLRIIDVSNPTALVELGGVETSPHRAYDVEIAGGTAFVAASSGLRVIDVSNPSAPIEVGALDSVGDAQGVDVAGSIAYVADRSLRRLWVIDVSNPAVPVEIGYLQTDDTPLDVEAVGPIAYVASGFSFRVIDVSNPATPVEVGMLNTPGVARDVEVVEGLAFVYSGDFCGGVRVIDVSNPTVPFELGAVDTPDLLRGGVAVADGLAYVADGSTGLRIIDFGPEYVPTQEAVPTLSPWWQLALVAVGSMGTVLLRRRASRWDGSWGATRSPAQSSPSE